MAVRDPPALPLPDHPTTSQIGGGLSDDRGAQPPSAVGFSDHGDSGDVGDSGDQRACVPTPPPPSFN
jgi:hypothetical protein